MALWQFLKSTPVSTSTQLLKKFEDVFSSDDPEQLGEYAAVAGLLATVAYADLRIELKERDMIQNALETWMKLPGHLAKVMTDISVENAKELAGLEKHRYAQELRDRWDQGRKYSLLETLFQVAMSDGSVSVVESNEIQFIANGLGLEHDAYVAARATVAEYLDALKK